MPPLYGILSTIADAADSLTRTRSEVETQARTLVTGPRGQVLPPPRKRPDMTGTVLGLWRLIRILGAGGMGTVYLAEHTRLGRRAALKLLHPELASRTDSVKRFFQEARAVNKIRHRNIVDVQDFVELPDGTTFILMELLEGASLERLNHVQGPLPVPRILGLMEQVCEALAAAHGEGIVHRDLKPDNIFVVEDHGRDLVKLLDFGVAKLLLPDPEDTDASPHDDATQVGMVLGTPAFMSPEQAAGAEIDPRSDLYAVGAILYELVCGRPMFTADSLSALMDKHIVETPLPPQQTEPGRNAPPELQRLILRCVAKAPRERPQTARFLAGELRDIAASMAARVPRRRAGWMAAATLAVVAGGAAVLLLLPRRQAAEPPRTELRPAPEPPPAVPDKPAETRAVVTAVTPPAPARQEAVRVTFRTDPPGAEVRPDGHDARCTTPCDVVIDPTDGEDQKTRSFVLSRDGYVDYTVEVSLREGDQVVHATLVHAVKHHAAPPPAARIEPPAATVSSSAPVEPAPVEPAPAVIPPTLHPPDPHETLNPFGKKQ